MPILFEVTGLTVRTMEPSDAGRVLSVYKQCEDFLALGPVPVASQVMVTQDFRHSASEKGRFCVIESRQGEVVGVLDFTPHPEKHAAVLSLLMISRHHRGKGFGKATVAGLESYLRDTHGVHTIESGVQVNNPAGIAFWKNRGFAIGTVARHHHDGTTAYDMVKNLHIPKRRRPPGRTT